MRFSEVRAFALSLPGAYESPHFELMSFRVKKKIFATYPEDEKQLRIFVAPARARALAAEHSPAFEELWWGRKLAGILVHLAAAKSGDVLPLVEESYRMRAGKRA